MQHKLYSATQAHQLILSLWRTLKPALESGKRFKLTITEWTRSNEQNAAFHKIIAEIATQAAHMGAKWSAADWKRLLLNLWAKETNRAGGRIIPSLDGSGIVQLDVLSRDMSVDDASEFIEWLKCWAAENGVTLDDVP
jgi:hypothetical protein